MTKEFPSHLMSPAGQIERLDKRLADFHIDKNNPDLAEVGLMMTQQLHIAVYGATWARPVNPRDVWRHLLGKVLEMKAENERLSAPSSAQGGLGDAQRLHSERGDRDRQDDHGPRIL